MRGRIKMILIAFTLVLIALAVVSCATTDNLSQFGGAPAGERLARMEAAPNYNDGKFHNTVPTSLEMRSGAFSMISRLLFGKEIRRPETELPVERPIRASFETPPRNGLRITRMGHSTVLVEIDGSRILTDPIWSKRSSPTRLAGPARFHPAPIPLEELPALDAVMISHDHFDHLDKGSVCALSETDVRFFVPLGVGAHLEKWGIAPDRITELYWWESAVINGLQLVATPARHFSGRGISDRDATLWTSWTIIGPENRVFFGGDGGFFPGFEEIGEKYGPFDITLLECGAYDPNWPDIHMAPEQTVDAHLALKGNLLVPIHWGTFNLSFHSWFDPPERLIAAAREKNVRYAIPRFGQMIEPSALPMAEERWWKEKDGTADIGQYPDSRTGKGTLTPPGVVNF